MGLRTYPKTNQDLLAKAPKIAGPILDLPPTSELEVLIRKIVNGDSAALAELYDLVSVPLYSLAFGMLQEEECACQVLHEAFSWIWHNACEFDHADQSAFSWLVGLVRQRALARSRKTWWRKRSDTCSDKIGPLHDHAPQKTKTAQASEIQEAFRRLSQGEQEVIKLAFFGGFDQQRLAQHLNITPELVRKLAAFGLIKFREALQKS